MLKLLHGHTSQETAYIIADYPYGSLRCQRRVWIETGTRKGCGQRFVAQTQNPKNGKWNKPHAGTYSPICVMYLNPENNHVECAGLGLYTYADTIEGFVSRFGEQELCQDPHIAKLLPIMRKIACKRTLTEEQMP
jgi:hypothetical protein